MASQPPKVMRIGVFQGERCIEERLLRRRIPVTIGQTLSNTFVVPASSMPKSHKLFEVSPQGGYILNAGDRMGGRISLRGNEIIDLTRLKSVKGAKRTEGGYALSLSDSARGKITIGETRILFQFVAPPPATSRMLPSAMGGGALAGFSTFLGVPILIALAISAIFQIAPLFAVMLQDWPEPEGYNEIPDWYLDKEAEAQAEEEEEKKDDSEEEEEGEGEGEEDKADEVATADETPIKPREEVKKAAPKDTTPKSAAEVAAQKTARKDRGKKIVGQVFGVEGGESVGVAVAGDIISGEASISALDGLSASDIGGPGGGGEGGDGLNLGLGGEGDPSGDPGLSNVETKGNDLIGSGPETAKTEKRKKAKLKVKTDTMVPKSVEKGDKKGIEKVFKKKKKQVENCYKRVIQKYGDQAGKIVVKITIGTDGSVLKVKVTKDEIGKNLASCIEAKIKRWKFPAVQKPVTVAKRWVFG